MHFSPKCSIFEIIAKLKVLVFKYLQRTVKKFAKTAPTYVFSTWGAYDQIFSQFLKITFNNVVKKFAKFCNLLKMHKRKVACIGVSYSNFN